MRVRKPVLLVCLALLPVLGIFLAIRLYTPLELVCTGQELSGIFDDKGNEAILLTLALSNRSSTSLYFPRDQWVQIDIRCKDKWTSSLNKCSLSGLLAHRSTHFIVAVPEGSELCRMRVKHSPPTLRERAISAWFRYKIPRQPPKWLWDSYYKAQQKPKYNWTDTTLKVAVPSGTTTHKSDAAASPASLPSKT